MNSVRALSGAGKGAGMQGEEQLFSRGKATLLPYWSVQQGLAGKSLFSKTSIKGQLQIQAQAANNLGIAKARLGFGQRLRQELHKSWESSTDSQESMEAVHQKRATCSCCMAWDGSREPQHGWRVPIRKGTSRCW